MSMAGEIDKSVSIAPCKTRADWISHKATLSADPANWEVAFDAFFKARLESRYFKPIEKFAPTECDGSTNAFQGEGFAVVAILCSLIEFLETCRTGSLFAKGAGKTYPALEASGYRYGTGASTDIFTCFLTTNLGLEDKLARDFYAKVRCAILHNAMTEDPWVIRVADTSTGGTGFIEQKAGITILYRDLFCAKLHAYVDSYRTELLASDALKQAFIRKFDSL